MNGFQEIANPRVLALEPRVSVIVITYAQADTLERTIASIAAQRTKYPYEIILSEDCSPDGTRELARRLQERHPGRVRLLLPHSNLGMGGNFALALSAVRGEYVAICEGDDYWIDTGKLERQVAALDEHPEVDLCFSDGVTLLPDGTHGSIPSWNYGKQARKVSSAEILGGVNWQPPTASLMWRQSATNPWPEWLHKAPFLDIPLIIATSGRGGGYYDPAKSIAYRIDHPSSFSVRLQTASYSARAALSAEGAATLRRSCAEFGVPVELLSRRLQDRLLSEVRHHISARRWGLAARRALGFSPLFLLKGIIRRLIRLSALRRSHPKETVA